MSSPPNPEETTAGVSNPHAGAAVVLRLPSMRLWHAPGLGSAVTGTLGHVWSSFRLPRYAAAPSELSAKTAQISRGWLWIKLSTVMCVNGFRCDGGQHLFGMGGSQSIQPNTTGNRTERTHGRRDGLALGYKPVNLHPRASATVRATCHTPVNFRNWSSPSGVSPRPRNIHSPSDQSRKTICSRKPVSDLLVALPMPKLDGRSGLVSALVQHRTGCVSNGK